MIPVTGVRIDKWLWAARFFKTRGLASKACDLGRIRSNGIEAKAAREVRLGDRLHIKNEGGDFEVQVLELSEIRGPAAAAQKLYRETEASKEARMKVAEERKAMRQYAPIPAHRPSKRDRRRIFAFAARVDPDGLREPWSPPTLVDSTAAWLFLFASKLSVLPVSFPASWRR
jgi:ribosome-associated heat shock protein Hsp15